MKPAAIDGGEVHGISPSTLRDVRRTHGCATTVSCHGSSLTAKLAIGGRDFNEFDLGVEEANPPLKLLLRKLWDHPTSRAKFVFGWRQARHEIEEMGLTWSTGLRGPIGAVMLHLRRIGAEWPRPFVLKLLGHDVDLLQVTPLQVGSIVAAHARLHLDLQLLRRLCAEHGWMVAAVLDLYNYGIDWTLLRKFLWGKMGHLSPVERRALTITASGGLWPEARCWEKGLRDSPDCCVCKHEKGTQRHKLHDCPALQYPLLQRRLMNDLDRPPREVDDNAWAPLVEMGLPPKARPWTPTEVMLEEGSLSMQPGGFTYGDGSGFNQAEREGRVATWSAIRATRQANGKWEATETIRGNVGGWNPTVPRGEISALIAHLKHAGPGNAYVGDCRHVIEGARDGVPDALVSSTSLHADLWREVRRLQADHGGPMPVLKTKAHRTQAMAERDADDDIGHFHGNRLADQAAKSLARSIAEADPWAERQEHFNRTSVAILKRVAVGAALTLQHKEGSRRKKKANSIKNHAGEDEGSDDEVKHVAKRTSQGIECSLCKRSATGQRAMAKLRREACSGAIEGRIDDSHRLRTSNGVVWCEACGAYMTRWPRRLLSECARKPQSVPQKNVLRRLQSGLPPTTAGYLASVAEQLGAPAHARARTRTKKDGGQEIALW